MPGTTAPTDGSLKVLRRMVNRPSVGSPTNRRLRSCPPPLHPGQPWNRRATDSVDTDYESEAYHFQRGCHREVEIIHGYSSTWLWGVQTYTPEETAKTEQEGQ